MTSAPPAHPSAPMRSTAPPGGAKRHLVLLVLAVASLWRREVVRFLRQRSRIVGALATPIVFWLLLGSGLGRSFRAAGAPDDGTYLQYFFPGTIVMILLFSAIFSTISIIEDRREGFLQSVLVAPVPRVALVLGNVLGGTTLAAGQAAVLLSAAPWAGLSPGPAGLMAAAGWLLLIGFGLASLGFLIAWQFDSTQGFHAVMNLVLVPLWMLSGAVFPASGAPGWLQWVVALNPVSYHVAAVRRCLVPVEVARDMGLPGWPLCAAVSTGFAACLFILCVRTVEKQNASRFA